MIGRNLDLYRPRYKKTAAYGHFGREPTDVFTWEKVIDLKGRMSGSHRVSIAHTCGILGRVKAGGVQGAHVQRARRTSWC